jgi:hypoxanthine phosphoribosyltransferase
MKSYDYAHRQGVLEISWDDFAALARQLAEKLEPYHVQAVVGIARAGLFPATAVACSLRTELYPARLTRRLNDQVIRDTPIWKTPISPEVAGKIVAVVDEMSDSGRTLCTAAEAARSLGAVQVVTASLVAHSWADPMPEACALVSDAFVIFPWDRQVLLDGKWQPHPETAAVSSCKMTIE